LFFQAQAYPTLAGPSARTPREHSLNVQKFLLE
jgi:hypothetical protein